MSLFFGDEVLGGLEGCLKSILKVLVDGGSSSLGLLSGLRSLGLEGSGFLGLSILLELGEDLSSLLSEWVELLHHSLVGKWVLLVLIVGSNAGSNFSKLGLNLIGVDDSADIGAAHDGSVESITLLLLRDVGWGSEDGVEGFESVLGENDESTEVTTWGELEDVKSVDVASIDTWEISGGLLDTGGLVSVNDEWSLSHDVSGVSVFSSS